MSIVDFSPERDDRLRVSVLSKRNSCLSKYQDAEMITSGVNILTNEKFSEITKPTHISSPNSDPKNPSLLLPMSPKPLKTVPFHLEKIQKAIKTSRHNKNSGRFTAHPSTSKSLRNRSSQDIEVSGQNICRPKIDD